MLLTDLEALLEITITEGQKKAYEKRLAAAIDLAKKECNNNFEDELGQLKIPEGAQMGVALIVKAMGEKNNNVASQGLGDMSKSFFEGGTYRAALGYLRSYRKVKFI
jgi:hypothetical protein